jgi:adenosylhomocysteinase
MDPFQDLYELYPAREMPFLQRAKRRAERTRPYQGLKVAHHVPLTLEAALKIEVLARGGADLLVTCPGFMAPSPRAVEILRRAGIRVAHLDDLPDDIDVALDCCAELYGRVRPRLGACELTGTGTARYRAERPGYPVIAVDESRVKDLEGLLGTGDGFVRAFRELVPEPIEGRPFLVFGYGKVGRGIVRALRRHTGAIGVVDVDPRAVEAAARAGCDAMIADDVAGVEGWARRAFAIVTATGVRGAISARYDPGAFRGRNLANMGGEDEYGDAFSPGEVLYRKGPVNFASAAPTSMKYLDPVFYAHNLGIDLLAAAPLAPGVHPFPRWLAEEIVDEWERAFGEELGAG